MLKSALARGGVGGDSFGIVNSGRGPTRTELEDWLKPIMMKIAKDGKTRACATLGALTPETAKFLYDCGIRRINHNLETSERHYPNIVTTHPFSERINTLKIAKEAGLSLCSGGIFGMGEEWADRLDMMFTLRESGRRRDADQFPERNPRHAAGESTQAAADGMPEDHRDRTVRAAERGIEGRRRARSVSARSAELDLLRRRRQHDDRQLSDDLRPQARDGSSDGDGPGADVDELRRRGRGADGGGSEA